MSDELLARQREVEEAERAERLMSFFNHPIREERHRALELIVNMGPSATAALVRGLGGGERHMRSGSLRALVRIADPRAVPALVDYLETHGGELGDNRAFAMQALAASMQSGREDARRLHHFLERAITDADVFVRGYAYEALGKIGDPRLATVVQRGLADPDAFVQERATLGLAAAQSGPLPAVTHDELMEPIDIEHALQAPQASRRELALSELVRRTSAGQDMLALVLRVLTGPNRLGRQTALEALSRLRDPRALLPVLARLRNETSDDDLKARCLRVVAATGVDSLDRQGRGELLRDLVTLTSSGDVFVRAAAVEALGRIPSDASVTLLVRAAADADDWVREGAHRGLKRVSAGLLKPHVKTLANHATDALRAAADPDATAAQVQTATGLLSLLETAAEVELDPPSSESVLATGLRAMGAAKASLRIQGLHLLEELAHAGYRPELQGAEIRRLCTALTSGSRDVLTSSITVLERWLPAGATRAAPALLQALHHAPPELAVRTIHLLARTRDTEARAELRRLSLSGRGELADAARAALRGS
jgi:HEAT repeat protein